ncbi:PREDICTED: titin homolog [Tarenaya hassleriana]|uniref:titin homolog n=1 Tax=Tarenaya hassleriana TaxID=28532 RepID=UPI00053C708F|nr:PREDICTED: titin homolog [Tarenaya hassleriana]
MIAEVERLQGELPSKVENGNVDEEKQDIVGSGPNQDVANGISHGGNDNGNGNGNCNGDDKEETDGSYVFVTENDTVGDDHPEESDSNPHSMCDVDRPSDSNVEKSGDGVAKGQNGNSVEQKMENGRPVDPSVEVALESNAMAEPEPGMADDGLVEAVAEITKSEIGEREKLESTEEVDHVLDSEVEPSGLQETPEEQINSNGIDVEGDQGNKIEGQDKSDMDVEQPVEMNDGRESTLVSDETSLDDPMSFERSNQTDSGYTFNVSESVIGSESTAVAEPLSIERGNSPIESDAVKGSASDENGDVQMVPEAEKGQSSHDADAATEVGVPNANGDAEVETQTHTVPSLDEDASKRSESRVLEVHDSVSDEGAELELEAIDIPASDERSDIVGLVEDNVSGTAIADDDLSCTNQQEPEHDGKPELVETLGSDADEVCQITDKEAESSPASERSELHIEDKPLGGMDSETTASELAEKSVNVASDEMDVSASEPEAAQSGETCGEPHVDSPIPEHGKVDTEAENNSNVNGIEETPEDVSEDTITEEFREAEPSNIKESSSRNAAEEAEPGTESFYNTEFPLLSSCKVKPGDPKGKENKPSWATVFLTSKAKTVVRNLEPEVTVSTDTKHTGNENLTSEAVADGAEDRGGGDVIDDGSKTSISAVDEKPGVDVQSESRCTADTADDATDAKVASACEDSDGQSVNLHVNGGTPKDHQASASSGEVSAVKASEGHAVVAEIERKQFYFLPKVPRYVDEKLAEQLRLAEAQVDQNTQTRDAIGSEIQNIKVTCNEYDAVFKAAIAEEKSARKALQAKRQEIESLQSVINRVKSAVSVDDIDSKIRNMEHMIQHETLPLNEEKRLIREIKQQKQLRDQISSNMGTQDEVRQALDDKEKTEELLKAFRKELDMLRNDLSKAEAVTKAARKRRDEEWERQSKLREQFTAADSVRQDSYVLLQGLKKQLREKNKYFFKYRDDLKAATEMALKKDREALQSFCLDQVEAFMNLWNDDEEFRTYYIRCNTRSTLRRLGTLDGRSLGPDEEPTQIPRPTSERASNLGNEKRESIPPASAQQEKATRFEDAKAENTKVLTKPAEQKNQSKKPAKSRPLPGGIESVSSRREEEEESETETEEKIKLTKEEEERLRKAEEKRKAEEAEKMKEKRRLEEIEKAKEAMERKKKREEKAKARAALRAQKEAEEKEKEREKKLRKKERKAEETTIQSPENALPASEAQPEIPKEIESSEKQISAANPSKKSRKQSKFVKKNKSKSIPPPPPPLRNRSSSKRRLRQYMWIALVALVVLALFLLGNANLSSPANLWFLI